LLMPAIGHLIDVIIGLPGVAFGLIVAAFALHIWKSMTANAIRAGWEKWVPEWAMRAVADELEHKIARAVKRRQEKVEYLQESEGGQKLATKSSSTCRITKTRQKSTTTSLPSTFVTPSSEPNTAPRQWTSTTKRITGN